LREDLIRIFKRIGFSSVEEHLPIIFETGQAGIDDERIDISTFAKKLTEEVNRRMSEKNMIK